MKIKDIKKFREYVWETKEYSNTNIDIDFIGVENTENKKHGFFKMFHGISRVEDSIVGMLKIADDEQAIYELVQNANDCDAQTFELHYNDKYLIAFNNGKPFKKEDVIAILNESYSNKHEGQIGRFGVGFKIVHKLVGSNQGKSELIDEKKGPIIFSWDNKNSLRELLGADEETSFEYDSVDSGSPWFFKILITNFPIAPYESNIRDIDFKTISNDFFRKEDFKNFISYLKTLSINENTERGTILFLDLGEGKQIILEKEKEKVKDGLAYSLNFLKKTNTENELKRIVINDSEKPIIVEELQIESVPITILQTNLFADDKLKENDLTEIKFGYLKGDYEATLKEYPNLFKYFPLSEQKVGFNFILHSDIFEIDKNRLKIEYNPKNILLLDYFIKSFKTRIETLAKTEIEKYRNVFLAIYLSDDKPANDDIFRNFYKSIKGLIGNFIPITNQGTDKHENVVSNNSKINFELADWGITNKKWFYWNSTDYEKFNEKKYREINSIYNIEEWNLITCIKNADVELFNKWFASLSPELQSKFLNELESADLKDAKNIFQLKLFKFSDNKYYSANETASKIDEVDSEVKPKNLVFHSTRTFTIKSELEKLELLTSEVDIEKTYPNLFTALELRLKQVNLFKEVKTKSQTIELDSKDRKNVFQTFPELQTEEYFKNGFNKIEKLNNLLKPNKDYPTWLNKFSILESEYDEALNPYLIKDDSELFSFIYRNWATVITLEEVKRDVKAFYSKVESYFLLSANKKEALTKLPIVFVNDTIGFKESSEVYFHSTIKECNYSKIQNAIKTIFELEIPSKDALEFLSKDDGVFQITDDKNLLTRTLTSKTPIELTKDDVIEFVNFSISKIHEEFFNQFIISLKDKDIFTIEQKTENTIQVSKMATDAFKLIEATEKLKAKYKILPYALKDSFVEVKGILTAKNGFYSSLLKDKELLTQPKEIYKYLFDTTSQKEYISQQTEILIPVNLDIDIDGSVYKILEWCLDEKVISVDEYKSSRAKFKLQVGEEKFEVANSKGEIIVATITFSLTALLPKEPIDIKNEHTSNFLKQYSAKGLKEENLKLFFGVGEDISADNVFESMLKYKSETLTSRQVEFLFLFSKEKPEIDITVFSVETLSELQPLNQLFYTNSISFIKPFHILSDKYSDINILYCNNKILSTYSFNEKNELDTSLFKVEMNDEEKISLLEFVFGVWKTDKETFASFNIDNTYNFLGFQKNEIFLKDDYTVADEKLPSFYKTFLSEVVEKISFSIVIGINDTSNSAIELRKYFENNSPEKLFENIQVISPKLLHNTLQWLQEKGIVLSKAFHLETLKIIYAQIIPTDNTLFLFIDSFDTENNLCYKIKQAETDNYLIGDSELAKLNEYEITLKKIFALHEKSKKNLVKQSCYPLGFVFNGSFKQVQIPNAIICVTELQNIEAWKEEYFIEWKKINDKSIVVYLFDGEIPRNISFENENIPLERKGYEFESEGVYYISKDADNVLKSLKKILPQDLYEGLAIFKSEYEQPKPEDENSLAKSFFDEVNEFLNNFESDIENSYSSEIIAELKNMALGLYNESNITAMLNLIVKLKVCKKLKIDYSKNWGYNYVESKGTKYIVFSARRAFAYIHPAKIIELRDDNSKILIDFGRNLELVEFNSLEELFRYNTDHLFFYSGERTPAELEALCEQNQSRSGFRLLLVDKNKEISELTALFQITNRETYD